MTAYTTVPEVRQALAPIIGDVYDTSSESAAQLSDPQILDAIAQASSRIDTFIGARYQTPVAPEDPGSPDAMPPVPATYPDPIGFWCRDLAAYLASLTFFRSQPMNATEPIYLRQLAIIADMTAVRDGKQFLNIPPASTGQAAESSGFAGVIDPGTGGVFDAYDVAGVIPPLPGRPQWGGW